MCEGIFYIVIIILQISYAFPLPFNDGGNTRYKTLPWGTYLLIFLNTIIFMLWLAPLYFVRVPFFADIEAQLYAFKPYIDAVWTYGYRVTYLRDGQSVGAFVAFTSIFMHADLAHLMGNMAYLWAFGRRVEDACGTARFLAFYIFSGLIASLGSVVLNPSTTEDIPGIGASGAIAGVLAAYLLFFFDVRVESLWGLGSTLRLPFAVLQRLGGARNVPLFKSVFRIPSWILLIFFAISNTVFALIAIRGGLQAGVNYIAHYAGFVAGLSIFLFVRKDVLTRYFSGRNL
jgi:membrane associated rhomboid family serine protease